MDDQEKARRVIAANGQAPNLLRGMSSAEVKELAGMMDNDGKMLPGNVDGVEVSPRDRFRMFLEGHFESKKATSAEFDKITVKGAVRKTVVTGEGSIDLKDQP